jgi:hypothetical protein
MIGFEEVAVQDPDPLIVGQHQRDRSPWKAQDPEGAGEKRPKSGRS